MRPEQLLQLGDLRGLEPQGLGEAAVHETEAGVHVTPLLGEPHQDRALVVTVALAHQQPARLHPPEERRERGVIEVQLGGDVLDEHRVDAAEHHEHEVLADR